MKDLLVNHNTPNYLHRINCCEGFTCKTFGFFQSFKVKPFAANMKCCVFFVKFAF